MAHEMLENFNRARRDAFFKKSGSAGTSTSDDKAWKLEERRFFPMPGTFVITHYADDVEYRVDGMIEKNVDKCHEYLKTLAVASSSNTGCAPMREPLCLLLLTMLFQQPILVLFQVLRDRLHFELLFTTHHAHNFALRTTHCLWSAEGGACGLRRNFARARGQQFQAIAAF